MGTQASPTWLDLLKDNPFLESASQKKKKAHVSLEQRVKLLDFVLDNPELITHSSTKENEQALWSNLTEELNTLRPEKSVVFWKDFFKRWTTSIESKNENSLTMLDYKLKKFLKNINDNSDEIEKPKISIKKKMTIVDIENNLKEIEAEKTKLKIDIDSMQYAVVNHKIQMNELKKNIALKKRKCEQLSIKKANLNNKRRKIEDKASLSKD